MHSPRSHACRDITEGEEITITYSEDWDEGYYRVPLTETITAGFPLLECRCGATTCVGEIARKAIRGIFDEWNIPFLHVDNGSITVDRHMITEANSGRDKMEGVDNRALIVQRKTQLERAYRATSFMDLEEQ